MYKVLDTPIKTEGITDYRGYPHFIRRQKSVCQLPDSAMTGHETEFNLLSEGFLSLSIKNKAEKDFTSTQRWRRSFCGRLSCRSSALLLFDDSKITEATLVRGESVSFFSSKRESFASENTNKSRGKLDSGYFQMLKSYASGYFSFSFSSSTSAFFCFYSLSSASLHHNDSPAQ